MLVAEGAVMTIESQIKLWETFYKELFGMNEDFSQVSIPKHRPGFDRLIIVAHGVTLEMVCSVACSRFGLSTSLWRDIASFNKIECRDTKNGSYAILVRDDVDADRTHINRSIDYLKRENINGIMIIEYLFMALFRLGLDGTTLDCQTSTLCSGSCKINGDAVVLYFSPPRSIKVRKFSYIDTSDVTGTREVIAVE
jgi:hypothetical protein